MQQDTVQYSAVQYSTVQYSIVQCSTVQYSVIIVQYSTVQYSTVQCEHQCQESLIDTMQKIVIITMVSHCMQRAMQCYFAILYIALQCNYAWYSAVSVEQSGVVQSGVE